MPDNRTKYAVDVLLDPTNFPDYTGSVIWDPHSGSFAITSSAPGGGSQNLQQVTDVGDETTNQSLFLSGTIHNYADSTALDATSGFIIDGNEAKTHITPQFSRDPQVILTTLSKNNEPGGYPINYITYGGAAISQGDGSHEGDDAEFCSQKWRNISLSGNPLLDYATVSVDDLIQLDNSTDLLNAISLQVNDFVQLTPSSNNDIVIDGTVTQLTPNFIVEVDSITNQPLPGGGNFQATCITHTTNRRTSLIIGGDTFNDGVRERQGTTEIILTDSLSTGSQENRRGMMLSSLGNIYFFTSASKTTGPSGSFAPVSASAKISIGGDNSLNFSVKDPFASTTGSFTDILYVSRSGDEPKLGIGTTDPQSTVDVRAASSSTPANILLRTNEDGTVQVGEETGRVSFVIESSSFLGTDFIASGSTSAIYSRVLGSTANGAYGSLIFEVNDNSNVTDPIEAMEIGYGLGPSNSDVGIRISASIMTTAGANIFSMKSSTSDEEMVRLGYVTADVPELDRGSLMLKDDGDTNVLLNWSTSDYLDTGNNFGIGTTTPAEKLTVEGSISASGDLTIDGDITGSNVSASGEIIAYSSSIDYLAVNDKLQGNGSGFQFFSFNEDTVKVKFANWYSTNDHQYGMGMLWYETWFGALEDTNLGNDRERRIGFYLETPNSGSTDSVSGVTGAHPTNARAYIDIDGMYISGTLSNTGSINSSGTIQSQGNFVVSRSGDFTDNEFLVADGAGGVESTDALAVDSSGNLGIGTNAPAVRLHMVGEGAQTSQFRMDQYNDTADAPDIRTKRARGTETSPSDIQTNDYLFRLNVEGQKGGSMQGYGSMQFDVDGSDADALNFKITTRDTAGSSAVRYQIDGSGDHEFTGGATVTGDLAISGISNVSASIAAAAGSGGGGAVATYTNGSNDRIITSTGTDGINGESTLTYNGTLLTLDGTMRFTPGTANNGIMTRIDNQWESTTLENNGEYIQVGTAISRTAHNLYVMNSSGAWVQADADAQNTAIGLLGVAVDGNSGNDFLIKGVFNTTNVSGGAIGRPVYISNTPGQYTITQPSGTGDVIRCVGYIVDSFASGRTTYWKIFFNPDPGFTTA